jgi:hypothetical protein
LCIQSTTPLENQHCLLSRTEGRFDFEEKGDNSMVWLFLIFLFLLALSASPLLGSLNVRWSLEIMDRAICRFLHRGMGYLNLLSAIFVNNSCRNNEVVIE